MTAYIHEITGQARQLSDTAEHLRLLVSRFQLSAAHDEPVASPEPTPVAPRRQPRAA